MAGEAARQCPPPAFGACAPADGAVPRLVGRRVTGDAVVHEEHVYAAVGAVWAGAVTHFPMRLHIVDGLTQHLRREDPRPACAFEATLRPRPGKLPPMKSAQPPVLGAAPRFPFLTLVCFRWLQLRNAFDKQLREAPFRAFAVVVLLVVIWSGLYLLLERVLQQVGRWELVALVANKYIFINFFLVLAVMLAFSNAVLAFTSIFGREEAGHLLGMPVPARHVIALKWIEGMLLSSWSFLLLGVPLMLAVAHNTNVAWYYYPLFVGHFVGFVLIPSTLGVLAAWLVALWGPRRPSTVFLWMLVILLFVIAVVALRVAYQPGVMRRWIEALRMQLSVSKQPLLPSTWTANGIVAAMERRVDVSLFYLGVVLANSIFFAWLTVNLIGRSWARSYSRAQRGRGRAVIRWGWFTEIVTAAFFFYLPKRLLMLMLKDLRSFARDPSQWMQMAIMLGLLIIYAMNLKRMPLDVGVPGMRVLLTFLNLTVVSLILATFTSRFVFPLLSLETQQLWLLGLLPLRRVSILIVKFAFALTITTLAGLIVIGLSIRALELPQEWTLAQAGVCLAICIGLSGLSVGLGARFPVIGQSNPARIASGFGGTVNLVASMLFVAIEMAVLVFSTLKGVGGPLPDASEIRVASGLLPMTLGFALVVAAASLGVGARHFARLEA